MDKNIEKNENLQKIIEFTVQVLSCGKGNPIVGTGILVSMDGKIITCTHVVEEALKGSIDKNVHIYMPQIQREKCKNEDLLQAEVIYSLPSAGEDLTLLKLIPNKKITIKPENIAVLGMAVSSEGSEFQSYGYCKYPEDGKDKTFNIIAHGVIVKKVPQNGRIYSIQLTSSQIDRGMSGAAVLDIKRNLVVGIVSDTLLLPKSTKNRETSWGTDMSILKTKEFEPYGIFVQEASETYEGIGIIEEKLKSNDPDTRQKQVERLGKRKYPFALSLLIPLLSKEVEKDDGVRFWVACAIGDFGGKNANDALIEAKKIEEEVYPRQGIEYALKKIGYVFDWKKIPGTDDERLKEYLEKKYHVNWVYAAGIAKSENDKSINISKNDTTISLTLNDEESEAILEIENKRYKFIAKKENVELNIYMKE